MATIMDVAELAGVSIKTVSRVINNEDHVRPALREQVLAAIGKLDYRPNLAARQLAANRSFLISLVMYGGANSYFSYIALAAATECRLHGHHLVSETFEEGETGEQVIRRVTSHLRPDGIILAPPLCDDPAIVAAVERTGTPLVRLAGTGELYGTVVHVHEDAVSTALVTHLIGLGHRRIGLIAPPTEGHGAAQGRVAGYRAALAAAEIAVDERLIQVGDFGFASGARAAEALLSLRHRPTAIFAANDGMALGAMALAAQRGFSVPADLAVAGFDDSPGSRMVYPPLTTVRQPFEAMARAAVAILLGREIADEPLAHELLIRGSTSGARELILTELDA